jgi:hypothetical protein
MGYGNSSSFDSASYSEEYLNSNAINETKKVGGKKKRTRQAGQRMSSRVGGKRKNRKNNKKTQKRKRRL